MLPNTNPEDVWKPRPPQSREASEAEDRLIRRLLLGGAVAIVIGVLLLSVAITVMISMNFNPLNWLE